jgi:short-subunit dehydrogenase
MNDGVIILGGSSDIARALADALAARGNRLLLAGRDIEDLQRTAADLETRHQTMVVPMAFDATDYPSHGSFFSECARRLDEVEGVIVCYGFMADQAAAQEHFDLAKKTIDVNYTSVVSIMEIAAQYMARRGRGYLAGISSVAGDRGRQSNYIYGSSKAGLSAYLQGLRNRLAHENVHVMTIKPGFVDTAMTWGLIKDGPLTGQPARVAQDIVRALDRRRNVVYTVWPWRWVMAIIRAIPESIFKKLKL